MYVSTIIVEDFLDKPDIVRNSALSIDISRQGKYPGFRSDRADDDYVQYTKDKIETAMHKSITNFTQDSHQFQLCYENAETWIHADDSQWAAVLYLTPDAPVEAGTSIYRYVPTNEILPPKETVDIFDPEKWQIITMIGNVYNRLVIYKGDLFHRSFLPGFGATKNTARLTQVFFFDIDK